MRSWRLLISIPRATGTVLVAWLSYRLARRRALVQFRSTLRSMGLPDEAVRALAAEYPQISPGNLGIPTKA